MSLETVGLAGEVITVAIDSIAAGGDGVGRKDGLVVFVPRTAPGDVVAARIHREKRLARGLVERIDQPSGVRVEARCAHYVRDRCGGCQLQHLSLPSQLEAKRAIVADSFRRIARRPIEPPQIRTGESPWRYRHRLSLALRRNADGSWRAGMHAFDDASRVFALDDCEITDPRVIALWREVMTAAADLPDVPELRGTVRLVGERGAFTLEGATSWPGAPAFIDRLASFGGVWWVPAQGRRRRMDSRITGAAAASFAQVNPAVASELFAYVRSRVAGASPRSLVDAYAGTGDLAASFHDEGVRVTAIELDEEATAIAAQRLGAPSRAIAARVEDVVAGVLPADVVILNPPRAGLDARVTEALEQKGQGVSRLVYVSCDPATLARDIARLPSWLVASVVAFDMFPQTAHVETVVELTRSPS